ncbi:hypothetical protein D3C81_1023820 [compost metagenome]
MLPSLPQLVFFVASILGKINPGNQMMINSIAQKIPLDVTDNIIGIITPMAIKKAHIHNGIMWCISKRVHCPVFIDIFLIDGFHVAQIQTNMFCQTLRQTSA